MNWYMIWVQRAGKWCDIMKLQAVSRRQAVKAFRFDPCTAWIFADVGGEPWTVRVLTKAESETYGDVSY